MTPDKIYIGEYANYFIKDGEVFTHDNNKLSKYAIPEKVIQEGAAGHPYGYVIGESGKLYMIKGDGTEVIKITDGVKLVAAYWNWCVVVYTDGTIAAYKDGIRYSMLMSPGNIVQVRAAHRIVYRTEDGNVYELDWSATSWKADTTWYKTGSVLATLKPRQVVLPGAATWVTTSRVFFSAAIVKGIVYAWGDSGGAKYFGWTGAFAPREVPADENMVIVEASDHNLHAIDVDSFLHGQGGLGVGFVGNGKKESEVIATGGWPSMVVKTFQTSFVKISDRFFDWIAPGSSYKFRFAFREVNGMWNFHGYEKFGLLMTGLKMVVSATNTAHDTATAGLFSIATPLRVEIPDILVNTPVADGKALIAAGKYPPVEPEPPKDPRKVVALLYDDGTWENPEE